MDLTGIRPAVLAGGRATRFGSDKLRAVLPDGSTLIDRPIGALRAVFGPRVALVGECHARVAARADAVIADRYPGRGPIGGVVSALEGCGCAAVLVLPGDLPAVTGATVRAIVDVAAREPSAWAVVGRTARGPEPCIALYRAGALAALREAMTAGLPLHSAVPAARRVEAPIDPVEAANVNTPEDLRRALEGAAPTRGS